MSFITATHQPRTRQELYDLIRQHGKDAYVLDEMIRLGFWPASSNLPNDPANEIAREAELQKQLRALRTEQSRLYNEAKLLKEMRKKRLKESREKKKETKERRLQQRKDKAEAWQARKAKEILYLGDAVSGGLLQHDCDKDRLSKEGLPVLGDAANIASAMGIEVGELRFLAFSRRTSKVSHYQRFLLKKKSGGMRLISAPMPRLKAAQRWVLENVLDKVDVHQAAHGFRGGRSIVSNASPHVGQAIVINMDLENFFPTLTYPRVKGMFKALGYSDHAATVFGLLCTEPDVDEVELDGKSFYVAKGERHLPQGSPASPQVTNVICRRFDKRIASLAKKYGFAYTRYADDLSFSTNDSGADVAKLLASVERAVKDEGFKVHPKKTRIMRKGRRQEVTGVVVNEKVGAPRKEIRKLRAALHRIDTKGLAGSSWGGVQHDDGGDVIAAVLGYATFVRMVDPDKGGPLVEKARGVAKKHGWQPAKRPAPKAAAPKKSAAADPKPGAQPAAAGDDGKTAADDGDGAKPGGKKWWKLW
jgi:retron-type reverse transcriptase